MVVLQITNKSTPSRCYHNQRPVYRIEGVLCGESHCTPNTPVKRQPPRGPGATSTSTFKFNILHFFLTCLKTIRRGRNAWLWLVDDRTAYRNYKKEEEEQTPRHCCGNGARLSLDVVVWSSSTSKKGIIHNAILNPSVHSPGCANWRKGCRPNLYTCWPTSPRRAGHPPLPGTLFTSRPAI